MSLDISADVVLVFSSPQEVCELDPCLQNLVLMLSLCFLSSGCVLTLFMSLATCADAVHVFFCPQFVCELDSYLWNLVLMLSLCFPALSLCVNLMHVCGILC